MVSSSERDGYTLLVPTVTTLSIAPHIQAKMGVDPVKDFTPIARLGATNFFLVVRSSFPAKNMREWIDEVRRNPGKYLYGSSGVGTPHHIFMELLKKELGLEIGHVPYKGGNEIVPGPAVRACRHGLHGRFPGLHLCSEAASCVRSAPPWRARQRSFPGVPPIADTVPGFDWSGWVAFAGPPNMPKPIVDRIANEIAKFQTTPEYEAFLARAIMEVTPALTPEQAAVFVRNEFNRWGTGDPVGRCNLLAITTRTPSLKAMQ